MILISHTEIALKWKITLSWIQVVYLILLYKIKTFGWPHPQTRSLAIDAWNDKLYFLLRQFYCPDTLHGLLTKNGDSTKILSLEKCQSHSCFFEST